MKLNKRYVRIITTSLTLFFIAFIILYIVLGYYKVGQVVVEGNRSISTEEVIESTMLDRNRVFLFVTNKQIHNSLYNDFSVLENVTMKKKFPNIIEIIIDEVDTVGCYEYDDSNYVLYINGETRRVNEINYNYCRGVIISNVNSTFVESIGLTLANEFYKIDENIRMQVSQIEYSPDNFEKKKFIIYMRDGNTIVCTTNKLADKFNYYNILKQEVENYYGADKKGTFDFEVGMYFTPDDKKS